MAAASQRNHALGAWGMRSAFSLIELLVVCAIIVVLAGMLFTVLAQVRNQASRTVCAGNMRQVIMAFEAYRGDNGGLCPLVYPPGNPITVMSPWNGWTYQPDQGRWFHALEQYTGTYAVFNCPVAARINPPLMTLEVAITGYKRGTAVAYWGSPGCALCLMAYNASTWGRRLWPSAPPAGPMTPAKVDAYLSGFAGFSRARSPVLFDGLHWDDQASSASSYSKANQYGVWWPHPGKRANMAYLDGHVEMKAYASVTSWLPFQIPD